MWWWDEECREGKKEVRKLLRKWWRGEGDDREYREGKREYKILCKKKKEEGRNRLMEEANRAKSETEVWRIINRERGRRKEICQKISMEEWRKHFNKLLEGVEEWKKERREDEGEEEIREERLSREEVRELKSGKAAGSDGLVNEMWKYGGAELEAATWKLCDRVWEGERIPEEWKEGIIVPIAKKEGGQSVKDYRGVTLMTATYKIYLIILAKKLRGEMEERGMVPDNQAGFRKTMGTVDNIYTLNWVVGREVRKKGGKIVAFFVDLKAAFDSVERQGVWKAMESRGVSGKLRKRIRELYEETSCKVRIGEEYSEKFWTLKGVRQGCPLSPLLFNLFTADIKRTMERGQDGGVLVSNRKI